MVILCFPCDMHITQYHGCSGGVQLSADIIFTHVYVPILIQFSVAITHIELQQITVWLLQRHLEV